MSMSSYKPNLNCLSSGDYKNLIRHKPIDLMFVPAQTASACYQRPFVIFKKVDFVGCSILWGLFFYQVMKGLILHFVFYLLLYHKPF